MCVYIVFNKTPLPPPQRLSCLLKAMAEHAFAMLAAVLAQKKTLSFSDRQITTSSTDARKVVIETSPPIQAVPLVRWVVVTAAWFVLWIVDSSNISVLLDLALPLPVDQGLERVEIRFFERGYTQA